METEIFSNNINRIVNHELFWTKFDERFGQKFKYDQCDMKISNLDEKLDRLDQQQKNQMSLVDQKLEKIAEEMYDKMKTSLQTHMSEMIKDDEQVQAFLFEIKKSLVNQLQNKADEIINDCIHDPNKSYIMDKFMNEQKLKCQEVLEYVVNDYKSRIGQVSKSESIEPPTTNLREKLDRLYKWAIYGAIGLGTIILAQEIRYQCHHRL